MNSNIKTYRRFNIVITSAAAMFLSAALAKPLPEAHVGEATLLVEPQAAIRPIKIMNAGNNAPLDSTRHSAWNEFRALKVPYARTHDIETHYSYGGARLCAISALFPDFDADETDPKNYDFTNTDHILKKWHDAGTEIFFRFGEHAEDQPRKHFVMPPKDPAKWARICEHIIRHYNEGWANGHKWNIKYWEIWNEPDIAPDSEPNHTMWLGTRQDYFNLFKTTVKHLTAKFPHLKIGGPALCWDRSFGRDLMKQCRDEGIRPGFFSWHSYGRTPEFLKDKARYYRNMLDELGFKDVESIDGEWNYNSGWGQSFLRSIDTVRSVKGASFAMSMMLVGQDEPIDMMMYYDFRDASTFNGVFDRMTYKPTKVYWAFIAWRRLAEAGTQVKATLGGESEGVYAVAAVNAKGKLVVAVCRHTDDDNEFRKRKVTLEIAGRKIPEGTAVKLVDRWFSYGEAFYPVKNGAMEITLEPNAFAVLEL